MTHHNISHFFCSDLQLMSRAYTQCAPPPLSVFLLGGGGGLNFEPNFQKGADLAGPQLLEGVTGKEGRDDFFSGGDAVFTPKKLKSEIFNKKSL